MWIPLVDLKRQYLAIKVEIDEAIGLVLESGQFILGPQVAQLEQEVAKFCGVEFAVGVASGTDALQLALLASGILPGDEVITTPFTFVATVEAILHAGAKPVLVDIDPHTYALAPERVEAYLKRFPGHRVRAIIPVHLYGQVADMEAINFLAQRYGLVVIEDASQAFGSTYRDSQVGSLGQVGCFSFFPTKNLGAYGDGGMIITRDREVAERVQALRVHGSHQPMHHTQLGYNSRLDELQAAILRVKLRHLQGWLQARRMHASHYHRLLQGLPVRLPVAAIDAAADGHGYHLYTVAMAQRDRCRAYLARRGVATGIYYPLPVSEQEPYRHLGYGEDDLPRSYEAAAQVLSLPIYPELEGGQIEYVAAALRAFFEGHER